MAEWKTRVHRAPRVEQDMAGVSCDQNGLKMIENFVFHLATLENRRSLLGRNLLT